MFEDLEQVFGNEIVETFEAHPFRRRSGFAPLPDRAGAGVASSPVTASFPTSRGPAPREHVPMRLTGPRPVMGRPFALARCRSETSELVRQTEQHKSAFDMWAANRS